MSDDALKRVFAFGAMPPPEFAWQTGKTVATINFVRELEGMDAAAAKEHVIAALKDGRIAAVIKRPENE